MQHHYGEKPKSAIYTLLSLTTIILILYAGLYNEFFLAFIDFSPLGKQMVLEVRTSQLYFLYASFGLLALLVIPRVFKPFRLLYQKPLVSNLALLLISLLLPLFILEYSLRPFIPTDDTKKTTTLYMKDKELGWQLRPYAEDVLGPTRAKINGKGLRGPELDYSKKAGVKRILFLGDSVTFGVTSDTYQDIFPWQIEFMIEQQSLFDDIQSINAGVGGYSPWQEYIYFSREGLKYDPDLVVVSFVMNDVVEKFSLQRFGGLTKGWQLAHNKIPFEELISKSGVLYFTYQLGQKIRFGNNIQEGAKLEENIGIWSIIRNPDKPAVKRAWDITLENLGKIFALSEEHEIPAALVIFPVRVQLEDPLNTSRPQELLVKYAEENGIPVVDLLPVMSERMKQHGLEPNDYFTDNLHLSHLGSEVVAKILTKFILKERLLDDGQMSGRY